MKKIKHIIPYPILLLVLQTLSMAQGLEGIIIEKYYVSGERDTTANNFGGKLPVGSVTYRIYADLLPDYKFQAVFGIPGHELRMETTTKFFNNEEFGGVIANVIPERVLGNHTVMLDSWLSAGAASEGNMGILKADDNEAETVVNRNGLLQNESPAAGLPLRKRDGLIPGEIPAVTSFGVDSIVDVFKNKTTGSTFVTSNGSWACMKGSSGPTSDNRVLLAQLTTDGILTLELNIQIGTPEGGMERYVAKNPSGVEKLHAGLTYVSGKRNLPAKMPGSLNPGKR